MTDQPDPEDTCRPVEIDGETISVRGAAPLTEEGTAALTALVRAAKAKMAAEPPPVRQQLRAAAFNAVAPALKRHDEWLRLTVRRTIADAVLAAIEEFLDIGDAEAWCKTCRRVWDGPRHRCESDAEQAIARVREVLVERRREVAEREVDGMLEFGTPGASWCDAVMVTCGRIEEALQTATNPGHVPDDGPSVREAAADDRRWPLEKAGE